MTTLTAGTRVGVSEITSLIGVGGMGEVYRARDTKLGREVAIKVLPASFAADPDRRARFEREARLLASLNHPNIGAIYGVEESAGITALVLELVEGEPLADRLKGPRLRADGASARQAPLTADDALAIARQIADALDAAHERGIVHRDLKPANIVITGDGTVKVLDFGLAKAGGTGPAGEAGGDIFLTHSPTVIGPTAAAVLLGTAPYMSPEQARGKAVDKRTDVWAFGCVLYEMLTGRRAFAGDTPTDAVAAILARDPDWTRLPVSTPPHIRRLLRRCLEKEPKRRLRDIGDVRFDDDSASLAAGIARRRGPATMVPWMLVVTHTREIWLKDVRSGRQRMVLQLDNPRQVDAVIWPAGSRIAYTSQTNGFVADAEGGVARRICEKCQLFGFLSDNRRVLAVATDNGRGVGRVIDSTSLSVQDVLIGETVNLTRLHASPDDRWLPFQSGNKNYLIPLKPGQPPAREHWMRIDEPTTSGRPCGWSLDSRTLYLLLDLDGFRCLYGQRVDPSVGLVGQPMAARHFHDLNNQQGFGTGFGDAISAEGFLYEGGRITGNLWRLAGTTIGQQ